MCATLNLPCTIGAPRALEAERIWAASLNPLQSALGVLADPDLNVASATCDDINEHAQIFEPWTLSSNAPNQSREFIGIQTIYKSVANSRVETES